MKHSPSPAWLAGFSIAWLVLAGSAGAMPPAPTLKSQPIFTSQYADAQQFQILIEGLHAADNKDWAQVRALREQADDPVISKILLWKTSRSANVTFDDWTEALDTLQAWPSLRAARIRAEASLNKTALSSQDKLDWLIQNAPITGQGKLILAKLSREFNPLSNYQFYTLTREAWRQDSLPLQTVREMLAEPQSSLTMDDHQARANMLLWKGYRKEARLLLPYMRRADRRLIEARIALQENQNNIQAFLNNVPETRAQTPGLLYDHARWLRKHDRLDEAIPLLIALKATHAPKMARPRIWKERHIAIRNLIREKRFADVYALAKDHGLTEGVHFAEAEWMAGWVALRHLYDARGAAEHFRTLAATVKTPISTARAQYWLGRALDELGQAETAQIAYAHAAQWPFTFYGQLAAERHAYTMGHTANMDLPDYPVLNALDYENFRHRELVRAAILLADAGRRKDFETLSMHMDDRLDTSNEYLMLYTLAQSYLQPRAALRSAKTGLSRGMLSADAAWPKLPRPVPETHSSYQVEDSLVLALSRQESEFNPRAVSHAGAIGMMQLMPRTAKEAARKAGVPYRPSWLQDDPYYNLMLGRTHLSGLVKQFDGSYAMALAAYNAGTRRATQWAREYGDPRNGEIDIVDWVESIPYSETRNYVQRVLESLQVYRHRLQDMPVPIQLSQDLRRGVEASQINPS